jgi:hypothetical protein
MDITTEYLRRYDACSGATNRFWKIFGKKGFTLDATTWERSLKWEVSDGVFSFSEARWLADKIVFHDFSDEIFQIIGKIQEKDIRFADTMDRAEVAMFLAALWEYMT